MANEVWPKTRIVIGRCHKIAKGDNYSSATLTEGFPVFFLSCKANARVNPAKTEHGPHSSKIFVLFCILFVLCCSVYCLCVNLYCTTATGWLPNCVLYYCHRLATQLLLTDISYIILPSSRLPDCLSAWNNSASTGRLFMKFDI